MRARTALVMLALGLVPALLAPLSSIAAECTKVGPADVGASCSPAPAQNTDSSGEPAGEAPTADDARRASAEFLRLVNRERAAAGLGSLSRHGGLERIALAHARHMASEKRIYHNDGLFAASTVASLGHPDALGENVGRGTSAERLHKAFMDSARHRDNIMEGRYSVAGIGVVLAHGELWVVQTFMSPPHSPAAAGVSGPAYREITDAPLIAGPRLGAWRWLRPQQPPQSPLTAVKAPTAADPTKVLGVSKSLQRVPKSLALVALLIGFTVVLGAGVPRDGSDPEIV